MLGAMLSIIVSSCYNDNKENIYSKQPNYDCNTSGITFSNDITPIMENYCVSCHSGGNFDATDYNSIVLNATDIVDRINATDDTRMPKNLPPLTDCEISKIEIWVTDGSPKN